MSLPTYDEAVTQPNALTFVAPYLDLKSLLALCKVTKQSNKVMSPFLWSRPIDIIAEIGGSPGGKDLKQYFALAKMLTFTTARTQKFLDKAKIVRKDVREMVQIIDARPLLSPQWRRPQPIDYPMYAKLIENPSDALKAFHNLRFIIIDGLKSLGSNLDCEGVMRNGILYYEDVESAPEPEKEPSAVLLLSAAGCWQFDSAKVISSSDIDRALMYLDISETKRTTTWQRILSTTRFDNLRVLKLRGLRLTDQLLPTTAIMTGCRLWSLDVRNNLLTDMTLEALLARSFLLPNFIQPISNTLGSRAETLYEEAPVYVRDPVEDEHLLQDDTPLRPDTIDAFIAYICKNGTLESQNEPALDIHDDLLKATGLTHLYLSDNKFTSLGIRRLLRGTNRLQILDVGSVKAAPGNEFYIPFTTAYAQTDSVVPLMRSSGTRLETLRVHHSVVTHTPTLVYRDLSGGFTPELLRIAETTHAPVQARAWKAFDPMSNYRLHNLTLTDIPLKSFGPTISALTNFISQCATQERTLESVKSSSPAGLSSRRAPKLLSGLRTLRLEILPEDTNPTSPSGGSVSGDRDADEFLAQSMGDFSFFDDPATMSSISRRGSVIDPSSPVSAGGAAARPGSSSSAAPASASVFNEMRDVVEALREFRRGEGGKWTGKLELVVPRPRG